VIAIVKSLEGFVVLAFLTPVTVTRNVSNVLICDLPVLSDILICMAFVRVVYGLHDIESKIELSVEKQ
jgi:hypothetical protein